MRILIAGCGYLGAKLGERLVAGRHEVWALRRSEESLKTLAGKGLKPFRGDLLEAKSLKDLPAFQAVVMCQAPDKKENYEQAYYQGTRNLLDTLWKQELKKLIMISSTSVYGTKDGSWVDELTDPKPNDKDTEWLLKAENLMLAETQGIILRLGGIYGPGRNRLQALKEGRLKPSFSEVFVNRIYVEDAVSGIELLLQKGKNREIYLGVDNYPSTQKEFYEWLCDKLSLPGNSDAADKDAARVSNKRCSNTKIKALGLELKYPTFKEGYSELIKNELEA